MAGTDIFVPSARQMFLGDADGDADSDLQEREASFYSSIQLANGVTKRTSYGRLRELDEWLLQFLDREKHLRILDLGISAGVTTVELAEALTTDGRNFHITGTDLYITAYLLTANERESLLIDRDGNPIHYELDGRGIGHSHGRNLMMRFRIWGLKRFAKNWTLRFAKKLPEIKVAEKIGGFMVHPVRLLCRAIRENEKITVIESDIFAGEITDQFDLVRAANILNLAYFSEEKIAQAIGNIKKALTPGGLFLAARTDENDVTNATLFRLSEAWKFEAVERFGGGSELEKLIFAAML